MVVPTQQETRIFLSAKFDEHNNKYGKVWSPGYEFMLGTNTSIFLTLKIDL